MAEIKLAMPDANTIALVSVVVAGTTAIASPTLTGLIEMRREAGRSQRERRALDLVELRQLLDEMAVALEEGRLGVRRLRRLLAGVDPGGAVEAKKGSRGLATAGQQITRLRARIVVRLGGEHPVAEACETAVGALRRLALSLEMSIDKGRDSISWRELEELEQEFIAASDAYVASAVAVVGSDLRPDR